MMVVEEVVLFGGAFVVMEGDLVLVGDFVVMVVIILVVVMRE